MSKELIINLIWVCLKIYKSNILKNNNYYVGRSIVQNPRLLILVKKLQGRIRGMLYRGRAKNEFRANKNLFGNYSSYKIVNSSKIVN